MIDMRNKLCSLATGLLLVAAGTCHAVEAEVYSPPQSTSPQTTESPADATDAGPAAPEPDSKVERATRAVEGAVHKTGKAVKHVVDQTAAGAKSVAQKTGKTIRKVGEKIESVGSSK